MTVTANFVKLIWWFFFPFLDDKKTKIIAILEHIERHIAEKADIKYLPPTKNEYVEVTYGRFEELGFKFSLKQKSELTSDTAQKEENTFNSKYYS